MNLKKIDIEENGQIVTTWALTPDQYYFLVNYAVNDLIRQGIVTVQNITPEELAEMQKDDDAKELLESIDPKQMGSA